MSENYLKAKILNRTDYIQLESSKAAILNNKLKKHTTTLFPLSDHYILSREWRAIVDQVQTNYHGRPMVLYSVRCDRAVDYEGSSLWSEVF